MSDDRRPTDSLRHWPRIAGGQDGAPRRSGWAFSAFAGSLATVGAIGLSNGLLGLTTLLAPWRFARERLRAARPLLLTIGLYLLFLGGSILASHEPRTSLRAASDLFNFLVPVIAILVVRTTAQARVIARVLVFAGSVIALMALVQYATGSNHIEARPAGPFSHYMTLGGFLVLVDCFLLAWMAFGEGWRRWWTWASFALIQGALLVSYTRNAWIAMAVLLALVSAIKLPKLLIAWVPIAVTIVLLAPSPLLARFGSIFDLNDQSNYDRLCMGYAGVQMVRDEPVFGQGPRMARERYPLYRHPTTPRKWVPHLHNSYLNLAAERGLASLAAFLALLFVASRKAWRSLRLPGGDGSRTEFLAATLLVVLATLITGMFEDYWSDTEIQRLVLFALALPFCLSPSSQPAGSRHAEAEQQADRS